MLEQYDQKRLLGLAKQTQSNTKPLESSVFRYDVDQDTQTLLAASAAHGLAENGSQDDCFNVRMIRRYTLIISPHRIS